MTRWDFGEICVGADSVHRFLTEIVATFDSLNISEMTSISDSFMLHENYLQLIRYPF